MNIKKTFLLLTNRTYPYGTEKELLHLLPRGYQTDDFGNIFYQIGQSDVMFTAHLDTATKALSKVNHVINGSMIQTDETSILGADDKAGVTIMMYMMKKRVPGLYYFFMGEEVGCIGSGLLAKDHEKNINPQINKVISFDRRGLDSIITYQSSSRCCSDTFAAALAKELNQVEETFAYAIDPTGIYTDSAQFTKIYPECTNISVGYYSEHTMKECQDISHLEKLAVACTKINWNELPVERDPSKTEYRSYFSGYSGVGGYQSEWDEWEDWEHYSLAPSKHRLTNETIYFYDNEFKFLSSYEITASHEIVKIDLAIERVQMEEDMIQNFLEEIELEYDTMKWDGFSLKINYTRNGFRETMFTKRSELHDFMPTDFDIMKLVKKCELEEAEARARDKYERDGATNSMLI